MLWSPHRCLSVPNIASVSATLYQTRFVANIVFTSLNNSLAEWITRQTKLNSDQVEALMWPLKMVSHLLGFVEHPKQPSDILKMRPERRRS